MLSSKYQCQGTVADLTGKPQGLQSWDNMVDRHWLGTAIVGETSRVAQCPSKNLEFAVRQI
jgi:hypothetical protein